MRKKKRTSRGRRRFAASKKLGKSESVASPYGAPVITEEVENRRVLGRFLPTVGGRQFKYPPPTFAQQADAYFRAKRRRWPHGLLRELLEYEHQHPQAPGLEFNAVELPFTLVKQAMSNGAAHALENSGAIRRALARLYDVAWYGRGPDSIEAKRQLERLLPDGNSHPVTEHVPEIAERFRENMLSIRESNKLMKREFPREEDRVNKLAELYGETLEVVSATLKLSDVSFLSERLSVVLGMSVETCRKRLSKRPVS